MLDPAQVAAVGKLLDDGALSHRAIARRTGVSRGSVANIAQRGAVRPVSRHAADREHETSAEEGYGNFWGIETGGPSCGEINVGRCPTCGGLVVLPCHLCRVRRLKRLGLIRGVRLKTSLS